jgi:preprotein translocase subunit SecG
MQILQRIMYMFLYLTIAAYALMAVFVIARVLLQRRSRKRDGAASIGNQIEGQKHIPEATVAFRKRGWSNVWLPRRFETTLPQDKVIGRTRGAAPGIKKSMP